jgi:hypothetical protein
MVGFAAGIPEILVAPWTPVSRLTIRKTDLHPNYAHTVSGRAAFIAETPLGHDLG